VSNKTWKKEAVGNGNATKEDIKKFVAISEFNNVNELENKIVRLATHKPLNIVYDKHRFIELCVNLVNTTHTTNVYDRSNKNNTEYLNNKFLSGYRISFDNLSYIIGNYQRFIDVNFQFEEI